MSSALNYADFLDRKSQLVNQFGFAPIWIPDFLFDFQKSLVEWSIRKGRCAILADCGLGKTPIQLVWAENVIRHTNGRVLILTPLAVSHQTTREGEKFGIRCDISRDGHPMPNITITNYERINHFNPDDYVGIVCDESSILKNFNGKRKAEITEFMRTRKYRLLCTATAAPNDYFELGTSSEALGELGYSDMLTRFFKDETKKDYLGWGRKTYRFRGHSEQPFWKWVCSWARACRRPSDLGFPNDGFVLPDLTEKEHCIHNSTPRYGMLFSVPAHNLQEQRDERRITITERCEAAADIAMNHDECTIIWCHLNDEGDCLEQMIPGSVQISGTDSDEWKEAAVEWFLGERCICGLTKHGVSLQLAACGKKNTSNDGGPSIKQTHPSESEESVNAELQNKTKSTCNPITPPTSIDGSKLQERGPRSTHDGESVITAMPLTETKRSKRSKSNGAADRKRDGREHCSGSGLLFSITTECSQSKVEPAQSAERKTAATSEQNATTLTIATQPASFADCYAPTTTSDSENLAMTQNVSTVPRCTCGYESGHRVLISKPKIFGWGLNFQHCHNVVMFPSHSFESYYQAVRRCWRFGQTNPVTVTVVTTEGEQRVIANMQRKSVQADEMFTSLIGHMNDATRINGDLPFTHKETLPRWL